MNIKIKLIFSTLFLSKKQKLHETVTISDFQYDMSKKISLFNNEDILNITYAYCILLQYHRLYKRFRNILTSEMFRILRLI